MNRRISLAIIISLFSACSFAQKSTVYFYRLKSLAFANTDPIITVDADKPFTIPNGSYFKLETEADSIEINVSLNNEGIKGLKLEKGKNNYIQVEVLSPGSIKLIAQTEFSGKPAVERLEADKLATQSKNLETEKVTEVAPLPAAKEDQAVIYLYRPFNVTGMTIIAHVSDGKKIYELKTNSSTVLTEDAGEIILRTVNEGKNTSNTSIKLKLEKGKVYYVAVIRAGGALVLTETKEEYAKKEMKLE